ncbi:hypothetical protein AAFX91_31420 [Bradyrhizobium sp. 31Argb]|uniref:hypothetical protein n=1 Tax=Bradyrhizobium TaxID=374 RepID=UPI0004092E28|nr:MULTISPECIES: hypothetical protein [Bradyrhizobium]RZN15593.1 hypothetical protein CWO90_41420 [Bradyrhizobium sp. Leo121]TAI61424.1 hypothetical protein CWO89_35255 [Bradyrhizobium sp. Leo170]
MVSPVGGSPAGFGPAANQQAGATGDGDFAAQLAELERVSKQAQAKSIMMRRITTELSSEKKVADERVS